MAIHHSVEHMGAWFFAEMDADNNGIVTRAEREASVHREWFFDFSKVYLNGDGELTKDEYIKALRINRQPIPPRKREPHLASKSLTQPSRCERFLWPRPARPNPGDIRYHR